MTTKKTSSNWDKIVRVNKLLKDGEPGNISHDSYSGYSGYSPQATIDAVNEVIGIENWGFENKVTRISKIDSKLAVSNISLWVFNKDNPKSAYGQSRITRGDIGDALKGAQTDAIKKALSLFSIGNRAYLGLLGNGKDVRTAPATQPEMEGKGSGFYPASEKQRKYIFALGKELGLDPENTKKYIKTILKIDSFAQLSLPQAKEIIDRMIKSKEQREGEGESEPPTKGTEEVDPDTIPF